MVVEKLVIERCISTIFFPYRFYKCDSSFLLVAISWYGRITIPPLLLVEHEHRLNLIMQRIKIEISCYAHNAPPASQSQIAYPKSDVITAFDESSFNNSFATVRFIKYSFPLADTLNKKLFSCHQWYFIKIEIIRINNQTGRPNCGKRPCAFKLYP